MATAINDFIQGIIMIFGIIAVIVAVLNGQGGFYEAVKSLAEIESDVPITMGQKGIFGTVYVWSVLEKGRRDFCLLGRNCCST